VRAILGAGIEGVVDLAGTLDLGQLAAIAAEAACVVAMDSGTMHIAVGTGTPTVAVF
jgi:ADP-heptose:LPS heptosyltransferase